MTVSYRITHVFKSIWQKRAGSDYALSAAILRAAIAASFLISELYRFDFYFLVKSSALTTYSPKGIVFFLFYSAPPPLETIRFFRLLGLLCTGFYFLGLFTRS